MKIPVVWLNYNKDAIARGYWDQALLEDLLSGEMWQTALSYEFEHFESPENYLASWISAPMKKDPAECGAVIVIPAQHNADKLYQINAFIKELEWCLIILTGDEESTFAVDKLEHKNKKVWLMQPVPGKYEADVYLGTGYTPHAKEFIKKFEHDYTYKPLDWFFSGQITHDRRERAGEILSAMLGREDLKGKYNETDGFAQGMEKEEYIRNIVKAKAIPAPAGQATPDSFRVFEALEAGSVPVADEFPPRNLWDQSGYWSLIFPNVDIPFKIFNDYGNLEGYILDVHREYPVMQNKVFAFWQNYKRDLAYKLHENIKELSGFEPEMADLRDKITVLIPTSPTPNNPDTAHIETTVANVRTKLPDCEIIIMIDGVREEQIEKRKKNYDKYISRLLWLCNNEWSNVLPLLFTEHEHQANMTRKALELVKTPTILFVEHDAPITPDKEFYFEWDQLVDAILDGQAYVIRFHFEKFIPEPHKHLMIGEPELVNGVPLLKTVQWSQRPHLSSTAFYRQMIDTYFGKESRTMIEDVYHGVVSTIFNEEGVMGWHLVKLWIYHPLDGNIKRSYHIDARGHDPKYSMKIAYDGETPRFAPQPRIIGEEPGK